MHASLDKNDIEVQSQITKVLNLYLATFLGKTKFYGRSAFFNLILPNFSFLPALSSPASRFGQRASPVRIAPP